MMEGKATTVLANGWTLLTCQVNCLVCDCFHTWLPIIIMMFMLIFSDTGIDNNTDCETNLTTSAADMPVYVTVRSYSLLFPSDISDHINSSQRVQLRLVQSDHRGGFCDCWAVSNLNISFTASDQEVTLM